MAEHKNSFVLYTDYIDTFEALSDEEAGQLIKHLFRYVNDQGPVLEDKVLQIAFMPMQKQLKRDLDKWRSIRQKRSDAGRKGGEAKAANQANATSDKQSESNVAVTATVNVTVNDTVFVIANDMFNKEVVDFFRLIVTQFPKSGRPKTKAQLIKWLGDIDKLVRLDGHTLSEIAYVVKWARQDEFWSTNFISLLKLRKTDKQSVKYFDVFAEKCKPKNAPETKGDDFDSWFTPKKD